MRVAIVSEWYKPRQGGIEYFLEDFTAQLQASGVEIDVYTPVPGPDEINGVPITRLVPEGGYRFPPSRSANNAQDFWFELNLLLGRRPRALDKLREALRSGGYDAVHVHMGNTPFTYVAVNHCIELGLPVVATFHAMLTPLEQPLYAAAGRLFGCQLWPGRVLLSAVSSAAAGARRAMFGDARFTILPNAIDVGQWSAVRLRRAGRQRGARLELVSALRLHRRKRPLALLDAMAALPPEIDARLRVAGDGPWRARMETRIAELGLAGRVELCGQQTREALAAMLAEADLFLMPTRHESFGIAVLEARSAGVAVLAMRESGARDFLRDGTDSLLADDDGAFTAGLVRLATDTDLRDRLDAGAMSDLTGYGWDDILTRCRVAYAEAAALLPAQSSPAIRPSR